MRDNILILIPVKGNSKRLYRKNFKLIAGKQLWEWSLFAALGVKFEGVKKQILIVTEDLALIQYIENNYFKPIGPDHNDPNYVLCDFGIFKRPHYLSEDPYEIKETCLHVLNNWQPQFDTLIMLQPSNPLVTAMDIEKAYNLYINSNKACVRSIRRLNKSSFKSFIVSGDNNTLGTVYPFHQLKDIEEKNFPDTYAGNGSIVICDVEQFLKEKTLLLDGSCGYIVDHPSIDIDTQEDFEIAEFLLKERERRQLNDNLRTCKEEMEGDN